MTEDRQKSKAELLKEINELRAYVAQLEQAQSSPAVATLWESEEKYRSLITNVSEVTWTGDSNGNTTFVSPNVEKVYGYSPEEIYKQGDRLWFGRIHPDDVGKVKEAYQALFEKQTPFDVQYRIKTKDGKWIWLHDRSLVTYEIHGVKYADGIFSDVTERKKAEDQLKQFQLMVESAHDAIFFKDLESRYIVANNKVLEAFALPREKVIGKNDYEIMPNKDEASKNIEDDNLVFKTGKPTEITKRMTDADGKQRWFHGIKVPQFDDKAKVIGLVGIARDITERKQAEQELQVKTAILQNIISNIPYYVFWKDKNSIYLWCNDNFAKLAGVEKPEDIIGKTDYDLPWKKEESDFYRKIDKEVVSNAAPILNIEEPVHHGKGKVATLLTSKVPLRNADGQITGILGIFTDITERKHAEQKLRESEEKYRVLYETIKDGIAGGPMDGRITECNQAFADMLGYSKDELKNLTYQQVTPKRWHQMEDKIVKEQILKRGYSDEYEKEYIRKDGTVFPISGKVWLRTDKDGKPLGMWGIVRDITERKKAEQALRESQSRQRAILDSISDIAWLKDKDSRYIAANEALCKAFDIKLEDLVGKNGF